MTLASPALSTDGSRDVIASRDSRWGEFEHAAHEIHRPGARMLLDERERHLSISANADRYMQGAALHAPPVDFTRPARQSRPPGRTRMPSGPQARLLPMRPPATEWTPHHRRAALPQHGCWIPSSAVNCSCGVPLLSSGATTSRLNSGVNSRLVFVIEHLPTITDFIRDVRDTGGASSVVVFQLADTKSDGDHPTWRSYCLDAPLHLDLHAITRSLG